MEIFEETIIRELPDLTAQGVRTRFIGRRDRAPAELRARMEELEQATATNDTLLLWIAFDYGGRAEIVDAARALVASGVEADDVDEARFAAALYAPDMPDPDLLIRTSGELRISNFLLWQIAYAELYFTERLWPDFDRRDLEDAIEAFARARPEVRGPVSSFVSRLAVVVVGLPVVLGLVHLGGWWLFGLAAVAAVFALTSSSG